MNIAEALQNSISEHWPEPILGHLKDLRIKPLKCNGAFALGESPVFGDSIGLLLANMAAAFSTKDLIGTATEANLKSTKARIDNTAAYMYAETLKGAGDGLYVAASEAKDERGDAVHDPLRGIVQNGIKGMGMAVDVVDGTTLAAKGINGAYTLSAAAQDLLKFPDLQAYAIGAPGKVLDSISRFDDPESDAVELVERLCSFHGKPKNELSIVTHSFDTGRHHSELIRLLQSMGVNVIIPDPVIVEPPYTLSMALGGPGSPDAMIGVFGLPEIVINTLLLGIIDTGYELRFRIASNEVLQNPECENLNLIFDFSKKESDEIKRLGLSADAIYSKGMIAKNYHSACFAATAITDDGILGIRGISSQGDIVSMNTVFSAPNNNTFVIESLHECPHRIDYSACRHIEIDDLSLVASLSFGSGLESFLSSLKARYHDCGLEFVDNNDFHVTLYEYGVHYGGFPAKGAMCSAFDDVVGPVSRVMTCSHSFLCDAPLVTDTSIIIPVDVGDDLAKLLESQGTAFSGAFFNAMRIPNKFHITLVRFSQYLSRRTFDEIKSDIKDNAVCSAVQGEYTGVPKLVHITETPYRHSVLWEL